MRCVSSIEDINACALLQVRMLRQLGDAGGVVLWQNTNRCRDFAPLLDRGPSRVLANLLLCLKSSRIAERNQAADWHRKSWPQAFVSGGVAVRYGRVLPLNLGALMPFRPLSKGCP